MINLKDLTKCEFDGVPNSIVSRSQPSNRFSNKILIDSTEFQQKVLDYIYSCEIDKMIDTTVFKDNQECKQAIIHGMVIASMLTSRCKQIEINEVADMKKCIILEIENKTDFENKMNEYLSEGYKIEASSCNSKYYKAIMLLEKE